MTIDAAAGAGGGAWFAAGASIAGASHARDGAACDDAWSVARRLDGALVACVCDGAGSAPLGGLGARMVADAVASHLASSAAPLGPEAIVAAHAEARDLLVRAALAREVDLEDLACTSVAVVASAGGRVVVGHVGDGGVVVRGGGEVRLASAPARGDEPGETWFLTSPRWREHLRVAVVDRVDAFAAFTDGCERAALELDPPVRAHQPFARSLLEYAIEVGDPPRLEAELRGLLESPAMAATSDDDKTLVLAARAAASG